MENFTHSLVGVTLAELALPAGSTSARRRTFFVAGIVAANLPDADLLYTAITPGPLGYLLHHRGHTHTLIGIVAQALLIGAVCLLPAVRQRLGSARAQFVSLIAVALLSHLVLDSWNSYGVHPFWPFDSRWFYGDAIYIGEPWLWMMLGVPAAMNTASKRGRVALGTGLALIVGAVAWFKIIPVAAFIGLLAGAAVVVLLLRTSPPRRRSLMALTLTALFVTTMFGLRARVHAQTVSSLAAVQGSRILDVVLNPQPANPLCWDALAIATVEGAGELVMTRGTTSPLVRMGCGADHRADVQWDAPTRQPLERLRALHRDDCAVRAWLQFSRAPEVGSRTVGDARFGGAAVENFSSMPLRAGAASAGCPPNLTNWGMPRADLFTPLAN